MNYFLFFVLGLCGAIWFQGKRWWEIAQMEPARKDRFYNRVCVTASFATTISSAGLGVAAGAAGMNIFQGEVAFGLVFASLGGIAPELTLRLLASGEPPAQGPGDSINSQSESSREEEPGVRHVSSATLGEFVRL